MQIELNDTTVAALKRVLPKAISSLSANIQSLAQEIDLGSKAVGRVPASRSNLIKHHNMLEVQQDALITLLVDIGGDV